MNDEPPSVEEGDLVLHQQRAGAATTGARAAAAAWTEAAKPADAAVSNGPRAPFPWPPADGEGVLAAAASTWYESVFAPVTTFRRMPADAPLGPALAYFIGVTILASGIRLFWEMVLFAARPAAAGARWSFFAPTSPRAALVSFLFAPLIMLAALFVVGGIWHVLLRIAGGAPRRFGNTARVFAYAQGPRLFAVVPFVGTLVGAVWSVAIAVIGLRETHDTSTAKALTAVLLPIVLLLGLVLVLAVIVAAGLLLLPQAV